VTPRFLKQIRKEKKKKRKKKKQKKRKKEKGTRKRKKHLAPRAYASVFSQSRTRVNCKIGLSAGALIKIIFQRAFFAPASGKKVINPIGRDVAAADNIPDKSKRRLQCVRTEVSLKAADAAERE
jgi:hypothetical protein